MTTTTIQLQGAMIANPPLTTLWDGTYQTPTLRGDGRPPTPSMVWGKTLLKQMKKYGNYLHHLKGEKIAVPLLRMVWDASLYKLTEKIESGHPFDRLKGWTAPLLRIVVYGTLPESIKKYGNDRHHLKGRRSPSYYLDRAGWNPT